MKIRLNGWQRIGIVLSAIWLIVFALWALPVTVVTVNGQVESFHGPFVKSFDRKDAYCKDQRETFSNIEELFNAKCPPGAFVEAVPARYQFRWGAMIAVAIVPVVLAWLFMYIAIAAFRWIAAGFRRAT